MSATGKALLKTDESGDWLADIFDVMDGEPIAGIEMADELGLKDDVFAALEAQGEVETRNELGLVEPSSEGSKKRGRDADAQSASGPDGKMKKSQREKRRRDALNDHFMGLSALLDPASTEDLKTDKATIVTEAAKVIKTLRAELKRTSESLKEVSASNETLVKERESILQDKHKIEHQLACFMSSMPFASPLVGGPYGPLRGAPATANGAAMKPGQPGAGMHAMLWSFPPLIVQSTTAEEDAKLRAPVA
jgi:hypothetical protein